IVFSAFREISPGRLRESVGLDFEDFKIGQVFHHRPGITVYQTDNANEALSSLNQAAIHYDEYYSAQTEFSKPLIASTLTLQRAIGMGWNAFGRRRVIINFTSIRLTAPVFAGDTLYAATRIVDIDDDQTTSDCGLLDCEVTVTKNAGDEIATIV